MRELPSLNGWETLEDSTDPAIFQFRVMLSNYRSYYERTGKASDKRLDDDLKVSSILDNILGMRLDTWGDTGVRRYDEEKWTYDEEKQDAWLSRMAGQAGFLVMKDV